MKEDMSRIRRAVPKIIKRSTEVEKAEPEFDENGNKKNKNLVRQTIYMPKEVHNQLRELAFNERVKQQELIREAMDMLFRDRGLHSWGELKEQSPKT